VTATDCRTGKVRYFEKGKCVEFLKAVRASASLPYVSKMVWVEGVPCLDGGLAVKVPYEWALEGGYQKIVVIRTREWGYRREPETERSRENALLFYRDYREVANCLNSQCEQYNRQCEELERLHTEGRIYMLSPSQPINLGTMEGSLDKLAEVYYLGREDAMKHLDEIRGYLKSEVQTHE